VTFLSQLKSTLLYSLVGDHRSEGRSFARKTRVWKITHEKKRKEKKRKEKKRKGQNSRSSPTFYSYLSTCCFECPWKGLHTYPATRCRFCQRCV